jgi:hypothetical protein
VRLRFKDELCRKRCAGSLLRQLRKLRRIGSGELRDRRDADTAERFCPSAFNADDHADIRHVVEDGLHFRAIDADKAATRERPNTVTPSAPYPRDKFLNFFKVRGRKRQQ